MTEPTDIDALEALAEAATPGPWEADDNMPFSAEFQGIFAPDEKRYVIKADWDQQPENYKDAVFIAAANPTAILALIAELRQERERSDEAERDRDEFLAQRNEYIGFEQKAQADLARAREVIEKVRAYAESIPRTRDRDTNKSLTERSWLTAQDVLYNLDQHKQNGADDD